jgi:hypothetical protein
MKVPGIINGIVLTMLITIPIFLCVFPVILTTLQDQFPEEIRSGNPFFILFSPILDREAIRRGESSKQTMTSAIRTGTAKIADTITYPALTSINGIQSTLASTIETVREGVRKSISIPTRGLYSMGTGMATALNGIFNSVVGSFVGMIRKIQDGFREMANAAVVMIYTQVGVVNTLYSSIGFFMMLIKVLGGIVITLGIMMLPAIFLIPFAIALITIGSIMVNISLSSEGVLKNAIRMNA